MFLYEGRTFFWERENNNHSGVALNELFLFFKIKKFSDLKNISSSYHEYEYWNNRIKSIISSFIDFPITFPNDDILHCIPLYILEPYKRFKEQVLRDGLRWAQSLVNENQWNIILNFFENVFCGNVLEKLSYSTNTAQGTKEVSLLFAENFRFKIEQGSFNVFGLTKNQRNIIVPHDEQSLIFMADFRQFEFRTFLRLQGMEEYLIQQNIYESIGKDLNMKVEDVKIEIISNLYGNKKNEKIENFFKKKTLLSKIDNNVLCDKEGPIFIPQNHEDGKKIHTIIQTISQYVYIKKLDKILKLLDNKKSKFVFPLHDSIILSLRRDEPEVIDDVLDILEDETYKVKCYLGPNFKDLTEI